MARPMRTISIKLPERLDDLVSDLARRRRSSRSALVREALEALTTSESRSVVTLIDELIGSVDGPADLSTSPKHMAGYGK
jgi:metal-responsive CopG/Arc/MetJ family transcriptional regulator